MEKNLINAAFSAQQNAYAPYSKFKVGSALEANDGNIYKGCNVENGAFPLGQCAEATAIGTMITQGAQRIKNIVIVSPNDEFCYPCGGCRQKIAEFATQQTVITLVTQNGSIRKTTIQSLLPHSYVLPEENKRSR